MSRGYGYRRGSRAPRRRLFRVRARIALPSGTDGSGTRSPCVALEDPLDVEPVIWPDLRHERWVADQHDGERRPADPEGRPVRGPVTHARELGQRLGHPSQVVGRELRPLRPRLLRRLSRRHRWSRGRRLCSLPFGAAYRWELLSGGYAPCGHIHHPRYVRNGHTAEGCPRALRARERAGEAISTRSVNVALSTTKRAGKLAGTYLGRFPTAAASTVSVVAPRIAEGIPLPTPTKTTHERSTAQPSPPGLSMNAESPTPTSGAYVWPAYAGWATSLDIAARACAAST